MHAALAGLYPDGQPLTANLTTLLAPENAAVFADTKEAVELMKQGVAQLFVDLDAKLAELAKQAQQRANLRIDIETHAGDMANFEKQGAAAAPKLEASKGKHAAASAAFKDVEATFVPAMDRLDAEIAAMTTSVFQQVRRVPGARER